MNLRNVSHCLVTIFIRIGFGLEFRSESEIEEQIDGLTEKISHFEYY